MNAGYDIDSISESYDYAIYQASDALRSAEADAEGPASERRNALAALDGAISARAPSLAAKRALETRIADAKTASDRQIANAEAELATAKATATTAAAVLTRATAAATVADQRAADNAALTKTTVDAAQAKLTLANQTATEAAAQAAATSTALETAQNAVASLATQDQALQAAKQSVKDAQVAADAKKALASQAAAAVTVAQVAAKTQAEQAQAAQSDSDAKLALAKAAAAAAKQAAETAALRSAALKTAADKAALVLQASKEAQDAAREALANAKNLKFETKLPPVIKVEVTPVVVSFSPSSSSDFDGPRFVQTIQPEIVQAILRQMVQDPTTRAELPTLPVPQITFRQGSSQVTDSQRDFVAQMAAQIRKILIANPNEVIVIMGFADADLTGEAARQLAADRAAALAQILQSQFGISAANLIAAETHDAEASGVSLVLASHLVP